MRLATIALLLAGVSTGALRPEPGARAERASDLAEVFETAVRKVNEKHARRPGERLEDELRAGLGRRAEKALESLLEEDGDELPAALERVALAALDLALVEEFDRIRARLAELDAERAGRLGTALARPRFLLRLIGDFEAGYGTAFADDLDRVLDAYAEVFGAWEWSKVPGKKIRVLCHLEPRIEAPPHFAPEFPFHSQIDFPVDDGARFASPTSDGKFLFYGLCHELGHLVAMWGDREREEDHHTWAHYTGVVVVQHMTAELDQVFSSRLQDGRWRSLDLERKELAGVEPDLGTRDGTLATWLALHDAFGPRRLGDALRFLQEEDAGLRVNRVRYYGFAALREGLAEVLGKDRDGRARLAELLPR